MLPVNLRWAGLLLLASWLLVRAGIAAGHAYLPAGAGYPRETQVQSDLFRFDAEYYLDIARNGYRYDGDPGHSPNIVFAPLFPLVVRVLHHATTLDEVWLGFAANKIFLLLALWVWLEYLTPILGAGRARLTLLALVTSAGSYAFHAYYSEATMFLALGLSVLAASRHRPRSEAAGAIALGLSRIASLPLVVLTAIKLFVKDRRPVAALAALVGLAAYFGYLWLNFGEPFTLLAQIQRASWALFHPPDTRWLDLLDGAYLLRHLNSAFDRGASQITDIRTLNLIWLVLGVGASGYLAYRRRDAMSAGFLAYTVFIYVSSVPSEFLISVHRFMLPVVPIFICLGEGIQFARAEWGRAAAWGALAILFGLNWTLALLHAAAFNQGVWFYF